MSSKTREIAPPESAKPNDKPTPWESFQPILKEIERAYREDPDHVKLPADLSARRKHYLDLYLREKHEPRNKKLAEH